MKTDGGRLIADAVVYLLIGDGGYKWKGETR